LRAADVQAGAAFKRAAEQFLRTKDNTEVTGCYREAAQAYILGKDTHQATSLIENECLPRLVDAGRMSQAAKLHEEVAKMFEDGQEFEKAIEHYGIAADLYTAENAASTASKSRVSVGRLHAMVDPPDFVRASEVFAEAGVEAMGSNLLKFQAKDLFQKAVLCTLAHGDVVAAEMQFEKFKEQDYTLECACGRVWRRRPPAAHPRPPHPPSHPTAPIPLQLRSGAGGEAASGPHHCVQGRGRRRVFECGVQLRPDFKAGPLEDDRAAEGQGAH
jgi:hypothetical protein